MDIECHGLNASKFLTFFSRNAVIFKYNYCIASISLDVTEKVGDLGVIKTSSLAAPISI